ncbi:hypothetical protein [Acidisphaera sp. S103]|uniref:hypothetical protein n=1 Tax=Acidisphaera sp. S103 TaxID=1747223 RepID=UPI00131B46FA|nr:hypothetical protein [Acidisphaera sp. S103]
MPLWRLPRRDFASAQNHTQISFPILSSPINAEWYQMDRITDIRAAEDHPPQYVDDKDQEETMDDLFLEGTCRPCGQSPTDRDGGLADLLSICDLVNTLNVGLLEAVRSHGVAIVYDGKLPSDPEIYVAVLRADVEIDRTPFVLLSHLGLIRNMPSGAPLPVANGQRLMAERASDSITSAICAIQAKGIEIAVRVDNSKMAWITGIRSSSTVSLPVSLQMDRKGDVGLPLCVRLC